MWMVVCVGGGGRHVPLPFIPSYVGIRGREGPDIKQPYLYEKMNYAKLALHYDKRQILKVKRGGSRDGYVAPPPFKVVMTESHCITNSPNGSATSIFHQMYMSEIIRIYTYKYILRYIHIHMYIYIYECIFMYACIYICGVLTRWPYIPRPSRSQ